MLVYLRTVLSRSARMFMTVARVMLPVMVIVEVARAVGLVTVIGETLEPAMGLLNLPSEAAFIWIATALVGIYGGVATLAALSPGLEMTAGQFSALAAMMLIAHAVPVEQAIVRRAGASFWVTSTLRIVTALVYGAIVSWTCRLTGALTEPLTFTWLRGTDAVDTQPGLWEIAQGMAFSLGLMLIIITVLLLVLDALERLGLIRRFTALMAPLLRLSGLEPSVAPVTTVGVLLGITYGGALIIEEAERQNYSPRTRLLALSWLSLTHSIIEDTVVFLALGADIWVVLAGRVAITMLIVAVMARLTRPPRTVQAAAVSP